MLHLIKLSVGVRDVVQLRAIQAARALADPPLCHRTRTAPRRRAELLAGGSIFWVIGGFVQVRQRLLDIIGEAWEDGSPCAGLVLDPELVAVATRPVQPFQGWRYLAPEAAPAEVAEQPRALGADGLPPALRAALREACLI